MIEKNCSVLLGTLLIFSFSCKEPARKNTVVSSGLNNKSAMAQVAFALHGQDSLIPKQNEQSAIKPACCKGVPSRLALRAQKKEKAASIPLR